MSDASTQTNWYALLFNDFISLTISIGLLVLYHLYLRNKVRKDPHYTVQAVNRIARTLWVETFMNMNKPDVIPVQTLRNSTMAATLLASTAVILIMGVLTLSTQAQGSGWQSLNLFGANHNELWTIKLIILLINLLVAFFSFSMAIRIYNHVGFLINVPLSLNVRSITPQHVATHLNSAGKYYSIGMRSYYYCVPLVFWLFGPHFMVASTVALIYLLYKHDRAPKIQSETQA